MSFTEHVENQYLLIEKLWAIICFNAARGVGLR
jgi:hypothetical protein